MNNSMRHWILGFPILGLATAAALMLADVLPCHSAIRNPNTDWFQKAGYGVFVHYLEDLQNAPEQLHSLGRRTAWDDCVKEFDAGRFAETMAQAGRGM